MKIKVEAEIFDDANYCTAKGNAHVDDDYDSNCAFYYANECELFRVYNHMQELSIDITNTPVKCDECKKAYQEAKK